MNPRIHLLFAAIVVLLLSSCEKDTLTPLPSGREAILEPIIIFDQDCHLNTPAFLVPKVFPSGTNKSIQIHYEINDKYTGNINPAPRAIKWQVGGETQLQLTDKLKLPYAFGRYQFDVVATLKTGQQLEYSFEFDVNNNLPLENDGCINYNLGKNNFDLDEIKESCVSQNGRVISIVIVDPYD